MRRKQTSLRRWKARCALGRVIPAWAIAQHDLQHWFVFKQVEDCNIDAGYAIGWKRGYTP